MNKIYAIIFSVLIIVLGLTASASAGVLDDFSNSTMSGRVIDGQAISILENISIYEPIKEELFGFPLKFARFKVVSFDGKNIVDDLLLIGEVGSSDTFFLSYRKIDEPFDVNAGGVLYNVTQHWDDNLPPVLIGLYIMESGNLLYTLYGEVEIDTGYYVGADVMLGMESAMNRDFLEGKVWAKHNFEPDGSTYGEIFLYNISGSTYIGGGVGFSF